MFDEESQKTIKEIEEIDIYPNTEFLYEKEPESDQNNHKYLRLLSDKVSSIYDYLDNPTIVFKNINQIEAANLLLQNQIMEFKSDRDNAYEDNYMFDFDTYKLKNVIYYNTIDNMIEGVSKSHIHNYGLKDINNFNENIDNINKFNYNYCNQRFSNKELY